MGFLAKNCGGVCHEYCKHWSENGCQHPENPGIKNVAAYPEQASERTAFRIKEGVPK
jgi:hypothetical protein